MWCRCNRRFSAAGDFFPVRSALNRSCPGQELVSAFRLLSAECRALPVLPGPEPEPEPGVGA